MMVFELDTVVVASKNQVAADLPGETVILQVEQGEYYGVDAIGSHIWSLIQEPISIESICDEVLSAFPDADPDQCTADVVAFVAELVDARLAVVNSDPLHP